MCRFLCVPVKLLEVVATIVRRSAHRQLLLDVSPATRCATASFDCKSSSGMTHTRSKLPNLADQHEVDIIDVAVVGGGPGGLSTAAAVLSAFGNAFRVKVKFLMFC